MALLVPVYLQQPGVTGLVPAQEPAVLRVLAVLLPDAILGLAPGVGRFKATMYPAKWLVQEGMNKALVPGI